MFKSRAVTFSSLPTIHSESELLSVARAMEGEAARRYQDLAERMERHDNRRVAEVFRELAAEEREHEAGIGRWAERRGVTLSNDLVFRWSAPESADEDAFLEAGGDYLLTPYKALALAVANEERAFAFWVKLAAAATDPDIRRTAEALAKEELGHIAHLRVERRRAFRAEQRDREIQGGEGAAPRPQPTTVAELRDYAGRVIGTAAARHGRQAKAMANVDARSAAVLAAMSREEMAQAAALSAGAPVEAAGPVPEAAGEALPRAVLNQEMRWAEDIYETFLDISEAAPDEDVVRAAQTLAESLLGRLAHLRDRQMELEEDPLPAP